MEDEETRSSPFRSPRATNWKIPELGWLPGGFMPRSYAGQIRCRCAFETPPDFDVDAIVTSEADVVLHNAPQIYIVRLNRIDARRGGGVGHKIVVYSGDDEAYAEAINLLYKHRGAGLNIIVRIIAHNLGDTEGLENSVATDSDAIKLTIYVDDVTGAYDIFVPGNEAAALVLIKASRFVGFGVPLPPDTVFTQMSAMMPAMLPAIPGRGIGGRDPSRAAFAPAYVAPAASRDPFVASPSPLSTVAQQQPGVVVSTVRGTPSGGRTVAYGRPADPGFPPGVTPSRTSPSGGPSGGPSGPPFGMTSGLPPGLPPGLGFGSPLPPAPPQAPSGTGVMFGGQPFGPYDPARFGYGGPGAYSGPGSGPGSGAYPGVYPGVPSGGSMWTPAGGRGRGQPASSLPPPASFPSQTAFSPPQMPAGPAESIVATTTFMADRGVTAEQKGQLVALARTVGLALNEVQQNPNAYIVNTAAPAILPAMPPFVLFELTTGPNDPNTHPTQTTQWPSAVTTVRFRYAPGVSLSAWNDYANLMALSHLFIDRTQLPPKLDDQLVQLMLKAPVGAAGGAPETNVLKAALSVNPNSTCGKWLNSTYYKFPIANEMLATMDCGSGAGADCMYLVVARILNAYLEKQGIADPTGPNPAARMITKDGARALVSWALTDADTIEVLSDPNPQDVMWDMSGLKRMYDGAGQEPRKREAVLATVRAQIARSGAWHMGEVNEAHAVFAKFALSSVVLASGNIGHRQPVSVQPDSMHPHQDWPCVFVANRGAAHYQVHGLREIVNADPAFVTTSRAARLLVTFMQEAIKIGEPAGMWHRDQVRPIEGGEFAGPLRRAIKIGRDLAQTFYQKDLQDAELIQKLGLDAIVAEKAADMRANLAARTDPRFLELPANTPDPDDVRQTEQATRMTLVAGAEKGGVGFILPEDLKPLFENVGPAAIPLASAPAPAKSAGRGGGGRGGGGRGGGGRGGGGRGGGGENRPPPARGRAAAADAQARKPKQPEISESEQKRRAKETVVKGLELAAAAEADRARKEAESHRLALLLTETEKQQAMQRQREAEALKQKRENEALQRQREDEALKHQQAETERLRVLQQHADAKKREETAERERVAAEEQRKRLDAERQAAAAAAAKQKAAEWKPSDEKVAALIKEFGEKCVRPRAFLQPVRLESTDAYGEQCALRALAAAPEPLKDLLGIDEIVGSAEELFPSGDEKRRIGYYVVRGSHATTGAMNEREKQLGVDLKTFARAFAARPAGCEIVVVRVVDADAKVPFATTSFWTTIVDGHTTRVVTVPVKYEEQGVSANRLLAFAAGTVGLRGACNPIGTATIVDPDGELDHFFDDNAPCAFAPMAVHDVYADVVMPTDVIQIAGKIPARAFTNPNDVHGMYPSPPVVAVGLEYAADQAGGFDMNKLLANPAVLAVPTAVPCAFIYSAPENFEQKIDKTADHEIYAVVALKESEELESENPVVYNCDDAGVRMIAAAYIIGNDRTRDPPAFDVGLLPTPKLYSAIPVNSDGTQTTNLHMKAWLDDSGIATETVTLRIDPRLPMSLDAPVEIYYKTKETTNVSNMKEHLGANVKLIVLDQTIGNTEMAVKTEADGTIVIPGMATSDGIKIAPQEGERIMLGAAFALRPELLTYRTSVNLPGKNGNLGRTTVVQLETDKNDDTLAKDVAGALERDAVVLAEIRAPEDGFWQTGDVLVFAALQSHANMDPGAANATNARAIQAVAAAKAANRALCFVQPENPEDDSDPPAFGGTPCTRVEMYDNDRGFLRGSFVSDMHIAVVNAMLVGETVAPSVGTKIAPFVDGWLSVRAFRQELRPLLNTIGGDYELTEGAEFGRVVDMDPIPNYAANCVQHLKIGENTYIVVDNVTMFRLKSGKRPMMASLLDVIRAIRHFAWRRIPFRPNW